MPRPHTYVSGDTTKDECTQPAFYQEFIPTFGMGKKTIFKDNSFIHGSEEFPYSQLSQITVTGVPSMMGEGIAEVTINGKSHTISFGTKDNERFLAAMTKANELIDLAHGRAKNYKYIFQSHTGSKVEVYEDYLMLYHISTEAGGVFGKASDSVSGVGGGLGKGLGKLIGKAGSVVADYGNVMKRGGTSKIIMFTDLTAFQLNGDTLIINEAHIPVSPKDLDLVKNIITYIEETLKSKAASMEQQAEEREVWESIKGSAKTFPILGEVFEVPENMDVFNAYRSKFRELASKCTEQVETEYNKKVHDLLTFMEFFPRMFGYHSAALAQQSVDILISEGVWTVTLESFMEEHNNAFHFTFDFLGAIVEAMTKTAEENVRGTASITSMIPNVRGFGFGLAGAAKAVAGAQIFNIARDKLEEKALQNATNLTPEQKQELYNRIMPKDLMNRVFHDYFYMAHTLVWLLNQNQKGIWFPPSDNSQADNLLKNLSNPNFPKEQALGAVLGMLKTNPYSEEYYKFLISRFGETDEITALKNYFGYKDFDNPRIM